MAKIRYSQETPNSFCHTPFIHRPTSEFDSHSYTQTRPTGQKRTAPVFNFRVEGGMLGLNDFREFPESVLAGLKRSQDLALNGVTGGKPPVHEIVPQRLWETSPKGCK